jgi:hypothetical protein
VTAEVAAEMAITPAGAAELTAFTGREYFAPLTLPVFLRKVSADEIALPPVKMERAQKGSRLVHLEDLAAYIDAQRALALRSAQPWGGPTELLRCRRGPYPIVRTGFSVQPIQSNHRHDAEAPGSRIERFQLGTDHLGSPFRPTSPMQFPRFRSARTTPCGAGSEAVVM